MTTYKPGYAGRWRIDLGRHACLHIAVRTSCWQWGYEESWYDGPLYSFGAGPLFLLCIDSCPD